MVIEANRARDLQGGGIAQPENIRPRAYNVIHSVSLHLYCPVGIGTPSKHPWSLVIDGGDTLSQSILGLHGVQNRSWQSLI